LSTRELPKLVCLQQRLIASRQPSEAASNPQAFTEHRRTPVEAWLAFGEVVGVHIRKDLLKDRVFDTFEWASAASQGCMKISVAIALG
jgi:hypothetical protein